MNLIELSNVFHNLALGLGFKFYHWGLPQSINTNGIDNSFNNDNEVGVQYPAIYAVVSDWTTASSNQQTVVNVNLLFCLPMYHDASGETITDSLLERTEKLRGMQINFMTKLQSIGLGKVPEFPVLDKFHLPASDGMYTTNVYQNAYNQNLLILETLFPVHLRFSCPQEPLDTSFFTPPHELPVSDTLDYEFKKT